MTDKSRPQTPLLTVDVIIEMGEPDVPGVILIERKYPPSGWALPGGFVDVGESVTAAARREAAEETGLEVELAALLGCYSDPRRDPRGHTASVVYVARGRGELQAGDDAGDARVFALDSLPVLAFDHPLILSDYAQYYRRGRPVPLR